MVCFLDLNYCGLKRQPKRCWRMSNFSMKMVCYWIELCYKKGNSEFCFLDSKLFVLARLHYSAFSTSVMLKLFVRWEPYSYFLFVYVYSSDWNDILTKIFDLVPVRFLCVQWWLSLQVHINIIQSDKFKDYDLFIE